MSNSTNLNRVYIEPIVVSHISQFKPKALNQTPNMKREGRQHGMVRSFCSIPSPLNPNPRRRVINKLDTPPTAGLFTKVTSKPTNHSKFTGRCGKPKCSDCHMQPARKAKDKAKGSHKLKSATDVSSDCKYVSWKVVDQTSNGMKRSFEYTATGILDRLDQWDCDDDDDDDECDEDLRIESDEVMRFGDVERTISVDDMDDDHEDWFFVTDNYVIAAT